MEAARNIILDKATNIITEKEDQDVAHTNHKDIIALSSKDNLKMKEAGEEGLSFETMRDQVMTFLGAGHDTTATGVAWTPLKVPRPSPGGNQVAYSIPL